MHGHTWKVTAWFKNDCRFDARCQQSALRTLLAEWDHSLLPDNLAWGEDIARAVAILCGVVEVEVSREAEGLHARWTCAA